MAIEIIKAGFLRWCAIWCIGGELFAKQFRSRKQAENFAEEMKGQYKNGKQD